MRSDLAKRLTMPKFAPVAVVDIGSNSVRLVVYDGLRRAPSPVFNEKVLCGLGRGVASTGKLDETGVARALRALARFRLLCAQMQVVAIHAIATAAAREATNGPDFIADAEAALGKDIQVLTGEQEAEYAALGVISSMPTADGVVGDLGGGSLELVDIKDGEIRKGVTLPLGPFRLMDAIVDTGREPRDIVEDALKASGLLAALEDRPFFAVGGAWRNLARLHMQHIGHPLNVLQQYTIAPSAARSVSILVGGMETKELTSMDAVAKKRAETLPLAALVLDRLISTGRPREVVFSVYGVREGVLFAQLKPAKKKFDPLISGCWDFARRYARSPEHEWELCDWSDQLFTDNRFAETEAERRLRHAACLLADIGWRASPDFRGSRSLNLITQANIVGLDPTERIALALTIYFRYAGPGKKAPEKLVARITKRTLERARQIAAVLRLAYSLTAAMPGMLPNVALSLNGQNTLKLAIKKDYADLLGEVTDKRLAQLANQLDCEGEAVVES